MVNKIDTGDLTVGVDTLKSMTTDANVTINVKCSYEAYGFITTGKKILLLRKDMGIVMPLRC